MAPQVGYMHLAIIKRYYSNLKPDSLEVDVDILWNNILPLYFDIRKDYGIEPQQRPYPGVVKTKADFMITAVRNGQPKKIVLIEDKRVNHEGSTVMWEDAVKQVTGYMKVARTANFSAYGKVETMYAIVTIGHYSRFYELRPNEQTLIDYENTDGQAFEFKKDEESIDGLLLDIVRKTSH